MAMSTAEAKRIVDCGVDAYYLAVTHNPAITRRLLVKIERMDAVRLFEVSGDDPYIQYAAERIYERDALVIEAPLALEVAVG